MIGERRIFCFQKELATSKNKQQQIKLLNMIKQIYRFLNPKFQNLFLEYKVDFKPRYGHGKPAHKDLHKIIDSNRDNYKDLILKPCHTKS